MCSRSRQFYITGTYQPLLNIGVSREFGCTALPTIRAAFELHDPGKLPDRSFHLRKIAYRSIPDFRRLGHARPPSIFGRAEYTFFA